VEKDTPRFSKEICEQGRIKVDESLIFPNLNPFGECHAVGIISKEHFLSPGEFNPKMVKDNLLATRRYILKVCSLYDEAKYPVYMWNYMPPSAASIVHPHVQILVESEPTPQVSRLINKSSEYYARNNTNYWEDLIKEEKRLDKRFIAEDDLLSVITSFAPRGFNEVCFIFKRVSTLTDINIGQMERFSLYLTEALQAYIEMGIGSLNLIMYSGPVGINKSNSYWLNAKLISRPYPQAIYTSDTGPMERLEDVWVIDTLPEEVAAGMKPLLQGKS
jgi:galactose-1-phosphate uridylyltransferase